MAAPEPLAGSPAPHTDVERLGGNRYVVTLSLTAEKFRLLDALAEHMESASRSYVMRCALSALAREKGVRV